MTTPNDEAPAPLSKHEYISAATHTREQILAEKAQVESALKAAKLQLAEAKRVGKAKRRFMTPSEFTALERRVSRLASKSQILQLELTRKKSMCPPRTDPTFPDRLVNVLVDNFGADKARDLVEQAMRATQRPATPL